MAFLGVGLPGTLEWPKALLLLVELASSAPGVYGTPPFLPIVELALDDALETLLDRIDQDLNEGVCPAREGALSGCKSLFL